MKKEDITHLAHLARISITDKEAEHLRGDIDSILEYVSVVNDIAGAEADTKKIGARYNVFRDDVVSNEPDQYTDTLLKEAPQTEGRFLKVKKILHAE